MAATFLAADDFRALARGGRAPDAGLYKYSDLPAQDVKGADRTKRFVFSDATVDHAGDSIDPNGWDLGVFKANGPALWAHQADEMPIGRGLNVAVIDRKLMGDIEFLPIGINPMADMAFECIDRGFLKAVSVGFMPKDWAFTKDKDRPYGIDFKKQTLLEISVCPVPCNPSALVQARAAGIDTRPLREWAQRLLDGPDTGAMRRGDVEGLFRQAAEPRRGAIRSAQPDHAALVAKAMADIGSCVTAHQATLADLRRVEAACSEADAPAGIDPVAIGHAIGNLATAVRVQQNALAHLKGAGEPDADDQAPPPATTPEALRQEAEALRRSLERPAQPLAERLAEAAELRRGVAELLR